MSRPEPRPALQRSGDGSVHPAAPRVSAEQHIHPAPHAPVAATKEQKKSKSAKKIDRADDAGPTLHEAPHPELLRTYEGKPVELTVTVPKDLRKQVRKAADKAGTDVDAVVTEALARHLARQD
jgi:hypothetical protein